MTAIAFVSLIHYYHINELHLFSDTLYDKNQTKIFSLIVLILCNFYYLKHLPIDTFLWERQHEKNDQPFSLARFISWVTKISLRFKSFFFLLYF